MYPHANLGVRWRNGGLAGNVAWVTIPTPKKKIRLMKEDVQILDNPEIIDTVSIHPSCLGCNRIESELCTTYQIPVALWRFQGCPMHPKTIEKICIQETKRLDPLKKSKRAARGIK